MQSPIHIAVLISGSGATLQNLIDLTAARALNAKIVTVIASKAHLIGAERAKHAGLPVVVLDPSHASPADRGREIFDLCDRQRVDLVCLAGWLRLIHIPDRWLGRVMNIHPSLLPSFGGKGMFGHHVHEAVVAHGCRVSGCTVHYVDNEYDAGPIILQRACPVISADTPSQVAVRVFEEEKIAYPEAIRLHQQGRLSIDGRTVRVSPVKIVEPQMNSD